MYEIDMHNIYNIIVAQKKYKIQEKATLGATFQASKSGRYPIG